MRWPSSAALFFATMLLLVARPVQSEVGHDENALPLFTVDKSQNRNLVRYMIRTDANCIPKGNTPVFAFWEMRELGPKQTAPLLPREQRAYGITQQRVTKLSSTSASIQFALRALPNRVIVVHTLQKPNRTCDARTLARISGAQARLFDVYVKLKWLLSVDYILLRGWSMDGKQIVSERIDY